MQIILLSGGEGKRLFPLSNNVRSKQFLRVLRSPDGNRESMLQRVARQIAESGLAYNLTVATGAAQADIIRSQLGDSISIVAEPSRRDTFPAIALASTFLSMQQGCTREEVVIVMPCDPYTDENYFTAIDRMRLAVENDVADLVLMGIRPTYASTKFGYVVPTANSASDTEIRLVERFTEKPDETQAEALIAQGAYWNGGVFAFRLGYILDIIERYAHYTDFSEAVSRYETLPKISFDYEVAEKASSVAIVPFKGQWKDLGTWNALSEQLPEYISGAGFSDSESSNTHIVNELNIPILCLGAKNLIVAASPDGILVCDKMSSERIKDHVDKIAFHRPMYEERRWGEYRVLDNVEFSDKHKVLTKRLAISSGRSTSYQSHRYKDEIWIIIDGEGELVLEGKRRMVYRGDNIVIHKGMKHAIRAINDLIFIEIQFGNKLVEDDIERYALEW